MIVIGVGNELRRDDGAGPAVIRELHGRCPPDVRLVTCDGEPIWLMELWTGADLAVVVDAVSPARGPGYVHEATDLPAGSHADTSCHGLGIDLAAELGRILDRVPGDLRVYGIEGVEFGFGSGLTPPVRRAVTEVAHRIAALADERRPRRAAGGPDQDGPAG
ncbi:hydrogenase maturation protease [Actinoallomurus soli]|uniref:hydrogenase maturation protease n=1 Tax=Actinoallomurus soli TaxID=2952535 RepID=UPI00209210CD|nr:hydrogenase maturation protease [Actinoallomurus soli]MCO5967784.1 hydrogenase maturation protease [Actinoallomurus soli]